MTEMPETRTIWKFVLDDDPKMLEIPHKARLVHVGNQNNRVCLWFEVDPSAAKIQRFFTIVGTGHPILPAYQYRGTTQIGPFVWHVYEMGSGE